MPNAPRHDRRAGPSRGAGRQVRAALLSPFVSQRLAMFVAKEDVDGWARVRDLVADGALDAPVDQVYPLDRVPDALADLAAGRIAGKAVISLATD